MIRLHFASTPSHRLAGLKQSLGPVRDARLKFVFPDGHGLGAMVGNSRPLRLRNAFRWWWSFWIVFFLSGLVFNPHSGVPAALDAAKIYRIAAVSCVAFSICILALAGCRITSALRCLCAGPLGWLVLYTSIGFMSVFWSVQPLWTAYKMMEYMIGLVLVATTMSNTGKLENYEALFDLVWLLYAGLLLTVWAGVIAWPDAAVKQLKGGSEATIPFRLAGVLPVVHPNGVGAIAATLAIVALARYFSRGGQLRYAVYCGLCLATLFLSQSRSAWFSFSCGLFVVAYAARRIRLMMFLGLAVCFGLLLSSTPWQYFLRGQDISQVIELSGRIKMWGLALSFITRRPLFGYGAMTGTRFLLAPLAPFGEDFAYSGADNVFIEVLLGVGGAGLVPLVASVLAVWSTLASELKYNKGKNVGGVANYALEGLGVLAVNMGLSLFTAGVFIWHPPVVWLLIVGYASLLRWRSKAYACFARA
ncbi:MAG: O-antigen ligase domain-containing protein [Gammaproteobacteria bacterium]|nr:MAG: O-antigen ligase domain-containing protein [Gammaproteobacteria bacterium]